MIWNLTLIITFFHSFPYYAVSLLQAQAKTMKVNLQSLDSCLRQTSHPNDQQMAFIYVLEFV